MIEFGAEYLASLGLDAAKQHVVNKIDEKKLNEALTRYIKEQKKYNEICTIDEECDFKGLIEYISHNMLDDVECRFFSLDLKERGKAHDHIVTQAVSYAKVTTDEARKRVAHIIEVGIEIVRDFFRSKKTLSDYFFAEEIVDAVNGHTDVVVKNEMDKMKNSVSSEISKQLAPICQHIMNGDLYLVENISTMIVDGKFEQIDKWFKKTFANISVEHPLYPDFGFTYDGKRLKSVPLNNEANLKYPAKYNLKGKVRLGVNCADNLTKDLFGYAYRHQLELKMLVSDAVKLLGNVKDPIQSEAEEFVGKEIIVEPPEFPKAFPCSIKVGEKPFFDYILLRIQEVLDDGTFVLGNREQSDSRIYFEVRFNPNNPKKEDFKINIKDATNRELLKYVRFMNELSHVKSLHIFALEKQEDFMAGIIDSVNYKTGFTSIEEEIDFLNRICIIEDYYNVSMTVPEAISEEEYKTTLWISDLIMNDKVKFTWTEVTLSGNLEAGLKNNLDLLKPAETTISYVMCSNVKLFETCFELCYMRTCEKAVIKDIEKMKQLVPLINVGDPIKFNFVPGQNNEGFDTLKIPEKFSVEH